MLHWEVYLAKNVEVPVGISIQVEAFVEGCQPHVRQMIVVEPISS